MYDTLSLLYELVIQKFPYEPRSPTEDGLLERLPGWIFVEWSAANDWVQDVNFPTNMLYARTLCVAAELYAMPELAEKGRQSALTRLCGVAFIFCGQTARAFHRARH